MSTREIRVGALARVEGEGALHVRVRDGEVEDVKFRIFEPPRFFEALLRGRAAAEIPDITSRICGICPIAYIMGASQAVEDAAGVAIPGPIHELRRLIYCGEWIQSHVLHASMLHAPDFLNLDDSIALARTHPELVKKALRLKKLGNSLMSVVGGRAVHPVNTRIGGFFRAPEASAIAALAPEFRWGIEAAAELARSFSEFDFPDFEQDYNFVSLVDAARYPILDGDITSSRGLAFPVRDFTRHVSEDQVAHSTALHGRLGGGGPYMVGPLARYANNSARLGTAARDAAANAGLGAVVRNPFRSILVRMVEVVEACAQALDLIESYAPPDPCFVDVPVGQSEGHGCTEAPRGICYHRYRFDAEGRVTEAQIVPPTSQNQPQIERDLADVVRANLDLDEDALTWRCEQTIRNYDPCISCATHFLRLTVEHV